MKAIELHDHMKPLGPWVDWDSTVDTFKAGDPDTEVTAIAVGWMSTLAALREAHDMGCNLFVTHEPTFYGHREQNTAVHQDRAYVEKKRFLQDTGMVVYRCHDVWDRVPDEGVQDSWTRGLGLESQPYVDDETHWLRVYEIEPASLQDLAQHVADRLAPVGQQDVQVVGDPAKICSRLATGIGAYGGMDRFRVMMALGADAVVATELCYWRDVRWAEDMGLGLIVCSHAASENWGVCNLAAHIAAAFPSVPVHYIDVSCPYRLVPGRSAPAAGS